MATKTDPQIAALKAIAKSLDRCAEGLHAIAEAVKTKEQAPRASEGEPQAGKGALEQFSALLSTGLKSALGGPEPVEHHGDRPVRSSENT